jgi:hypothetical protein
MTMRWIAMVLFALAASWVAPGVQAAGGVHTCKSKGIVTYTNLPCNRQHVMLTPASGSRRATASAQRADVYYKHTQGGVVVFSSKPPRGHSYQTVLVGGCYACGVRSSINWNAIALNTTDYATEISNAATAHGVEVALIRALIHAESAYNPMALSKKGAQGLMQLMPATAGMYGVTDAFDAGQNIKAGVEHLAGLLKRYDGDVTLVAAAYNAGEGAVAKYRGTVPPYEETKVYVERVALLRQRYLNALSGVNSG